jgi:hypothetical protein
MDELSVRRTATPFRYLRDPLFLGASLLYGLNRLFLKPRFGHLLPFLHNHWNDCLLVPTALPVLLWIFRKTSLRKRDAPPTWREITEWTLLWSILFEGVFPRFFHLGTADWRDALCYAAGAAAAGALWNTSRSSASFHRNDSRQ